MPTTREEKLLNSIATGMASNVKPITREEQYLSYIAGESTFKPDAPITRKEFYLDKIPQGGSGGGIVINNQNKTITENGTYHADSGYTGLGTVTVNVSASGGGVNKLAQVADRSVTEITAEDLQGVTKIGSHTFAYCKSLKSIKLPSSINRIDEYAFRDCDSLDKVHFDEGLIDTGSGILVNCDKLTSVIFPNTLTSLGNFVVQVCPMLEFLELGENVASIGNAICTGCPNLKKIRIKAINPPRIESQTFDGMATDGVIEVHYGCGEAYKSATNWSKYADQIVEGDV